MPEADDWGGVRADEVDLYWPAASPLVAAACGRSNGRLTPEAVYLDLKQGHMQLWLAHGPGGVTGAFVTQIIRYPGATYCRLVIGTGRNRKRWQAHVRVLEEWAKEQGCDGMESIARRGWARVFADWRMTHVFLERRL